METDIIRFNLSERGRTFRGKARNFNIPQIVKMINGGVTQEKVKHRDMIGYFGHWPRLKFGMRPAEGGIVDGRAVAVDPAMITTYLRAFPDGTVEHRAEFSDTAAGRIAQRAYDSKIGGFSSAIDENIPEIFGFDYVFEPNFTFNRGYALSLDDAGIVFDDVELHEYNQQLKGVLGLLDSLNSEHDRVMDANKLMQETIVRLAEENDQYLSMLARGTQTLDSLESVMPIIINPGQATSIMHRIKSFHSAELARFAVPEKPATAAEVTENRMVSRFLR